MSYELVGRLIAKYDTVQRTESFKTREFVIEKSEEIGGRIITNYAKFQCVQDKTAMVDRFDLGNEVKVSFNIRGTKWMKDGRENYITNLDAWKIEVVNLAQTAPPPYQPPASYVQPASAPPPPAPVTFVPGNVDDDLPF